MGNWAWSVTCFSFHTPDSFQPKRGAKFTSHPINQFSYSAAFIPAIQVTSANMIVIASVDLDLTKRELGDYLVHCSINLDSQATQTLKAADVVVLFSYPVLKMMKHFTKLAQRSLFPGRIVPQE